MALAWLIANVCTGHDTQHELHNTHDRTHPRMVPMGRRGEGATPKDTSFLPAGSLSRSPEPLPPTPAPAEDPERARVMARESRDEPAARRNEDGVGDAVGGERVPGGWLWDKGRS